MDRSNMYPIHTGFLTKSPPETRVTGSFKRWMKRWFVLWEDKTLQYFKDRGDDKPKKTIDLSRCEFLDTNLSDKKFENIFSIRIQSKSEKDDGRTFYLSADSPYEMQTWIEKICNLCDFKALESNNNKSDHKVRIRHQPDVAPLEKSKRDSGIDSGMPIVPDSDASSDLVPVRVLSQETNPAYDVVPPPIPVPKSDVSPLQSPSKQPDSCPLDTSSSESSLSSMKRSSAGSEVYQNCEIPSPQYDYPAPQNSYRSSIQTYDILPPNQPTYDYPPNQPTYDVPPSHPCNDSASTQPTYDVPPSQPTYDILPTYSNGKGMDRYSDGSGSGNDSDIYDVPPSSHSTYDTLPAPVSLSQTMPGSPYNRSPQYKNFNTISSRPGGLQFTDYNTLPPSIEDQPAYDTLPPRCDTLPDSNYDFVPAPKPLHGDDTDGHRFSPPINRRDKPQPQITTYVNIGPTDQYKKPLPCTPPEMQRDSGTVLDVEDIYNVPPVPTLPGHHAPSVDRSNKPGMSVAPPRVDRGSKPGVKGRDYVNLTAMRGLTVRDSANLARREGNLQRSKSAAADFESEGYLYMESPKRTDSSTRYSKTKKDNKIPEETDGNEQSEYEFMFSQKAYMNCETPAQTTQKLESSNERNTPLRGKYQEISVVGQCDAPFVPQRAPKTQYTTIDLEKTKGFRKTCEDVGKGQ